MSPFDQFFEMKITSHLNNKKYHVQKVCRKLLIPHPKQCLGHHTFILAFKLIDISSDVRVKLLNPTMSCDMLCIQHCKLLFRNLRCTNDHIEGKHCHSKWPMMSSLLCHGCVTSFFFLSKWLVFVPNYEKECPWLEA